MINRFPVAEGLVLDGDSDGPHVDDEGRDVDGVENECGHEIGALCAITVTTTTRQAM